MSESTSPTRTTRLRFLKEVYWRLGVLIVLVIYNTLQLVFNIIAWTTTPETQQKYQLIKVLQAFSLRTWIIGLLVLVIIITFEGAYRFVGRREIATGTRIERLETSVETLKEQLRPKLAILFEEWFPFIYDNKSLGHYGIRIGIKNVGGKELSRVKVQIDDWQRGSSIYSSLTLHLARNKHSVPYPYTTEFSLVPEETEYVDLACHLFLNGYSFIAHSAENIPDSIKEGQSCEFTITAVASEGQAARQRVILSANTEPPVLTLRLKS